MPAANSHSVAVPIGIDLGTTYSSIAYLTPQGQAVTISNAAGELCTPSALLFDEQDVVVGTEALRQSITYPERAVLHAKRFMGDRKKCWVIDGRVYRPRDMATYVLRSLLSAATPVLGRIRHAVITVPAQFSDLQRQDTIDAGLEAGLERVDIINEPSAAALCHVLGEGLWFTELAESQTVLVFDLGGGTFDLSLVRYTKSDVQVIATGGDLKLGGLDWNQTLTDYACEEYLKQSTSDPRFDRESLQALSIEVEQVKRSLSVRPRSTLIVHHDGRRKACVIDRDNFELLSRPLVDRLEAITQQLLKGTGRGWAQVDAVLITGGASRMPMVHDMLARIAGTTPRQTLSPDQSICHGAAYYAGMLLAGKKLEPSSLARGVQTRLSRIRQQNVSARALGILVLDRNGDERLPHYLIPANTPLPCAFRQRFGTARQNQTHVLLRIIESGTAPGEPHVEIGECRIEDLSERMPAGSPIEVTIRYDEQARIHVEAIDLTSGAVARASILRTPPVERTATTPPAPFPPTVDPALDPFLLMADEKLVAPPPEHPDSPRQETASTPFQNRESRQAVNNSAVPWDVSLEDSDRPVPLCNQCGDILDSHGECRYCGIPDAKAKSGKPARNTSTIDTTTEPLDDLPRLRPPSLKKLGKHKP